MLATAIVAMAAGIGSTLVWQYVLPLRERLTVRYWRWRMTKKRLLRGQFYSKGE